jgi:FKBP-type peptidyl-prolyl cis-trans isomerase FkpA
MLKKTMYTLFIVAIFSACGKQSTTSSEPCDPTPSTVVASTSEITYLQNYLTGNGIAATQHASGFFYTLANAGTGISPSSICSTVTVKYVGTVIGGTGSPFDSNTSGVNFLLANLIIGWQKGIPLLKKGGTIDLYIPPSMAYGTAGSGTIPGNAYLKFTIELLDVVN